MLLIYFVQHPLWNECFTFEVGEEDHYLNVCVWNKLSDERGDLLIGHVRHSTVDRPMVVSLDTNLHWPYKVWSRIKSQLSVLSHHNAKGGRILHVPTFVSQ